MTISLEVENLRQVQKNMEDVIRQIAKGKLVARAAYIIERQAKKNATGRPGPKVQTGRLRASITPQMLDDETAIVGTNVFYAPFVEYGHETQHSVGLGSRGGSVMQPFSIGRRGGSRTQAYPFLGPTIEQTKDEIGDVMVTFGKELGAEWSK